MTVRSRKALYMPNMKRRSMSYPRDGYQILGGHSQASSGPPFPLGNFAYEGQGAQWGRYDAGEPIPEDQGHLDVSFNMYLRSHFDAIRGIIMWGTDFQAAPTVGVWLIRMHNTVNGNLLQVRMCNTSNLYSNFSYSALPSLNTWHFCRVYTSPDTLHISVDGVEETFPFADYAPGPYTGSAITIMGNETRGYANDMQLANFYVAVGSKVFVQAHASEGFGQVSFNTGIGTNGVLNDENIHQPTAVTP